MQYELARGSHDLPNGKVVRMELRVPLRACTIPSPLDDPGVENEIAPG